jgi:hypothetical protein
MSRAIDGNERNAHKEQQERANQRTVPGISLTASETAHRSEPCFPRRDPRVGRHLGHALADQAVRVLLRQVVRGSSQPRSGRITR